MQVNPAIKINKLLAIISYSCLYFKKIYSGGKQWILKPQPAFQ
jgi:hypothetical protein